jgi:hypothetical protein
MKNALCLILLLCPLLANAAGADLNAAVKTADTNWLFGALGLGMLVAGVYFRVPLIVAIVAVPIAFILMMMSHTGLLGATVAVVVVPLAVFLIPRFRKLAVKSPAGEDKAQ